MPYPRIILSFAILLFSTFSCHAQKFDLWMDFIVSAQEPGGLIAIKANPLISPARSFGGSSFLVSADIFWNRITESPLSYCFDATGYTIQNWTRSDFPQDYHLFGGVLGACPVGVNYQPSFVTADVFLLGGFNLGRTSISLRDVDHEDDRIVYKNNQFGPKLKTGIRIKFGKFAAVFKATHQWELSKLQWVHKNGPDDLDISSSPSTRTLFFLGMGFDI